MAKRSRRHTVQPPPTKVDRLLSVAKLPLVSGGGAGAVVIAALSFAVAGATKIAAALFVLSWLLILLSLYEARWLSRLKRRRSAAILIALAVIFSVSWWKLLPPPPLPPPPSAKEIAAEISKDTTAPVASLRDSLMQVIDTAVAEDVARPFQPGQRIGINFTYANTGTASASNVHIHVRAAFVPMSSTTQFEKAVDEVFSEVYQEIGRYHGEGATVPPALGELPHAYVSAVIESPSEREIQEFNNNRKGVCAVIRIDYDYTHYYERCVVFASDHMQELIKTDRTTVHVCGTHNRSGTHPLGHLF